MGPDECLEILPPANTRSERHMARVTNSSRPLPPRLKSVDPEAAPNRDVVWWDETAKFKLAYDGLTILPQKVPSF